MTEEENGMDELLKLQQKFTRQQEEHEDRKRLQEEQDRKARGVLDGLRGLQFSMTLDQLDPVASDEIISQVKALKNNPDTGELRKMITNLAEDIESQLEIMVNDDPGVKPLEDSMRVLSILMDLYFSM
ncbi:MAG: hypothetical protein PVG61_07755 [Dehalococcoidia bacterium]|jgi:hypothetical protein